MNAWEQARVKQNDKPRYISDENRLKTEGARPVPRFCHDYPPQPKPDPKFKARLQAALGEMECALGKSNGARNDGTR